MSVVIAVKKEDQIVMASDSMTHFGSNCFPVDNHQAMKIFTIGSSYIAVTGWSMYYDVLTDFISRNNELSLMTTADISQTFKLLWKELHSIYPFVNDQCGNNVESPFGNLDSTFLVINKNGIFHIATDMSVNYYRKYNAIGSGCEFALGAAHALYDRDMSATAIAKRAVEAAMDLNLYCGGKIDLRKIELNE